MLSVNISAPRVKSLRSNLIQLVLVAVIPLLIFASTLVLYLSHQQNLQLEKDLDNRAKSISAIIDDKVNSIVSSLQILAFTEDFDPENFKFLHKKLIRAKDNLEGWSSLAVADLDGKQLIHTAFRFGDPLLPVTEMEFFQEVLKTGKPVFSNFRLGRQTQKKIISVAVPVIKNKRISLVLIGNMSVDLLSQTLQNVRLGEDWYATLLDRNFIILSRTRQSNKFIGEKASPVITDKMMLSETGTLRSINKEGVQSYSVFTKSELTGWRVVLGLPIEKISTFSNILRIFLLTGLLIIIIGVYFAIRIGKKISEPISSLSHSAEAFGHGYSPMAVNTDVEEVQILARNLELASLQRIRSENTIRTLHDISSSLSAELDMKRLLQSFTDQSVTLVRAEYGAYFHVATSEEKQEFFDIVTLSGAPIEKFNKFPLPRNTEIFGPTFRGERIVRFEDVTKEPLYGKNAPYNGIPEGHLPVRSYLAVPVISRNGDVLGGLFFGHSRPGVFTEQDEKLMGSLAAQAATAIDNAALYAKATQAVELRDTFLSVASHELKTPLTSIYLQFEILKRSTLKTTANDPKVTNLFDRFQSQLERLTRLINELLDVTRIASGKMSLNLEEMEISKLVSDICANFESEANQKGSPITLNVEQKVTGNWDPNRIEQVVMNLVSNAIKYGNKKPIEVTVTQSDKWALVIIKDRGMGIAPEDQARIFQRFERAIDATNISGLGLGLFICKEIILHHGGDIKVESALNEGSTFTLRLPVS